MAYHVDFLNKNTLRKYPLRATSAYTDTANKVLPLAIFSACRISTQYALSNVYIKKVYVSGDYINVTVVHRDAPTSDPTSPEVVLGVFSGVITSDYQSLNLIATENYFSGFLTIGTLAAVRSVSGTFNFTFENGQIEDSLIFCYSRPGVTKLIHNSKELTGDAVFDLTNLLSTVASPDIDLTAINVTTILSIGDKDSGYGNCPNAAITRINTVSPNGSGNIDIYGITPVEIDILTGKIKVNSNLTAAELCSKSTKNIPPTDNSDTYYTNILTNIVPEWKTWPQYL